MKKNISAQEYIRQMTPYVNKWVAVNKDESEVIASGKDIIEVEKKLEKNKQSVSHIKYILPFDKYYAPLCQRNR